MPNATTPSLTIETPQLLQDFILTKDIQLSQTTANSMAMFLNAGGLSEALVITTDAAGALVHVYRDSSSASGFSTTQIAVGVSEVVAGNVSSGSFTGAVAYFVGSTNLLYCSWNSEGSWSTPVTVDSGAWVSMFQASGLAATVSQDGSTFWVAGSTSAATLFVVTAAPGDNGGTVASSSSVAVSAPLVLSDFGGSLQILSTSEGNPLAASIGASSWTVFTEPVAISAFLGVSTLQDGTNVAIATDTSSNLVVISFDGPFEGPGTSTPVGIQVSSFAVSTNSAGTMRIYVVDPDGTLWVAGPNSDSTYTAIPIARDMAMVTACNGSDDVFAADTTPNLWYFSQAAADDSDWTSLLLQKSADMAATPDEISQYWSVVMATDQYGNPIDSQSVTFQTDAPFTIAVNGTTYPLDPSTPVSISTNAYGVLRISTPALGVSTPELTLTPDGGTKVTLLLSSTIGAFLDGSGSLTVPGTTGPTTLTGDVLLNAQNSSGGSLTTLQTSDEANSVATAITQMMAQATTSLNSPAAAVSSNVIPRWSLTNLKASPTFNRLAPGAPMLEGKFFSFGGFISGIAGSVWHGIESGALDLESVAVDAEKNIVQVTLTVVNDAKSDLNGAIQFGFDEISDFSKIVESVFTMIGADIDEVILWLRMLFNWSNIEDTQKAVMTLLDNVISALPALTTDAATAATSWLSSQQSTIDGAFANLATTWGASAGTFSSASSNAQSSTSFPFTPPSFVSVPVHWVLDKIESNLDWVTIDLPSYSSAASLTSALETTILDLVSTVQSSIESFKAVAESGNSFSDMVMLDAITAVKGVFDVLMTIIEGFVNAVQAFVADGLGVLKAVLQSTISVPVLSSIPGVPATTVKEMVAFAIALPATVAYEAATGQPPFPGGTLPAQSTNTSDFTIADSTVITMPDMYAIFSIPYLPITGMNDVFAAGRAQTNEPTKNFLTFLTLFNSLALLATSAPGDLSDPQWSGGDAVANAAWLSEAVGPAFDALATAYDMNNANVQLIVDSLLGVLAMALNVASVAVSSSSMTDDQMTSELIATLPATTSFFLTATFTEGTVDIDLVGKIILDALCISTSAITAVT